MQEMQTKEIIVGETYMIVNGDLLQSGNTFYGKIIKKTQSTKLLPSIVIVDIDGIELRCLFHPDKSYGWTFYKKNVILIFFP
jgi:hypothetical protein